MLVFNRQNFTQLWITIEADEPLALLSTAYLQDYFGTEGQLTLRNMSDDSRIAVLMSEKTSATPSIPHDVFEGYVDLTSLPNGLYRVEGRVRDSLGHYKILSEIQSPLGTEEVNLFEIEINNDDIIVHSPKEASVRLASSPLAMALVGGSYPTVSVKMPFIGMSASLQTLVPILASAKYLQIKGASVKLITSAESKAYMPSSPTAAVVMAYIL
jgi:hypothetical protein